MVLLLLLSVLLGVVVVGDNIIVKLLRVRFYLISSIICADCRESLICVR